MLLIKAVLGVNRAIVTEIPGTTRDYLEEPVSLDGLPVRLVDTAGLRDATGIVESLGIARSRELAASADLVLLVIDADLGPEALASFPVRVWNVGVGLATGEAVPGDGPVPAKLLRLPSESVGQVCCPVAAGPA